MTDETQRIERDLEDTRARLDARISELQDKLSPGQLLDQGLSYLKDNGGGEMGKNLKDSVVGNPMPLALIGAGLAWMMMGGQKRPEIDDSRGFANRGRWGEDRRDDGGYGSSRQAQGSWQGDEDRGSRGFSHEARPEGGAQGYQAYRGESRTGYAGDSGSSPGGGQRVFGTGSGGGAAGQMPWERHRDSHDDVAARAEAAAQGIRRRDDETLEAYEDRVYDARAGVLGLSRDTGEERSTFMERVDQGMHSARDMLGALKDKAAQMGERASEWLSGGREQAGHALHEVGELGGGALRDARDMSGRVMGGARDMGGRVMDGVRDMGSGGYRQMRHGGRSVRDAGAQAYDYVREQPWLLAAIGVAVGAAIGGMLPSSRRERQMMGPVGRDLQERAMGFADQAVRSGAEIGSEVLGAAADAAQREGLTVDAGKEAASGLAQKVRHVVDETVEAGKQALNRETGGMLGESRDDRSRGQEGSRGQESGDRPAGTGSTGSASIGSASTGGAPAKGSATTRGSSGTASSSSSSAGSSGSELPSSRDVGLARGEAEDIGAKTV